MSSADWQSLTPRLLGLHGEAAFKNWLQHLRFEDFIHGRVLLSVPTRFMREWITTHYLDSVRSCLVEHQPKVLSVEIIVRSTAEPLSETSAAVSASDHEPRNASPYLVKYTTESSEAMLTIGASLDPRFTFDNFVVGKPNELAYAASRRVAEAPTVVPGCNPLFFYGGVGLGKTHLMHAIAWHIRQTNPQRKVVYLSAEKFMYQFIRALRFNDTIAFKEQFRSVDVLMIDDVQFIGGKDSTQEEFFHTFNALIDQNKQLIISGDRSPSDLDGLEERIKSRLGWGLVADIHNTNYELRLGILETKAEKIRDCQVQHNVLEFLAQRITSNIRELEGALNRVVAHATLVGRPVTLETTQEVLADLLRSNDRRVTVEEIQKKVAEYYHIKVADMHSARRSVAVARPRQVAMFLAKQLTTKSLPEIGRKFGGKDHTTVMHAVKRVTELSQQDSDLADSLARLMKILQS
ncbi:MAG: chromosomal replication initiator protein DnaA [Rickettsiales bacterium]|nr:chromosomal replication initiator protein DnaA [Rickettsiales bacterium]